MNTDENWADLARHSRQALAELGYALKPRCLPDEPEACGGTFADHVMAQLAAIKAVADHPPDAPAPAGGLRHRCL